MRKTRLWTSILESTVDGDYLRFDINGPQAFLKAISGFHLFTIQTLAGSVRVFGSLDGENYAEQLALTIETAIADDVPAEQYGAIIGKTSSDKLAHFVGDYRALRFQQVGATPAQIRVLGASDE